MLRVFRGRAPMGRTTMAGHRCIRLPIMATGRLSRFLWMKAQMLYCLVTLESCSFQVRKRCSLGGKQQRGGWGICESRVFGLWHLRAAG